MIVWTDGSSNNNIKIVQVVLCTHTDALTRMLVIVYVIWLIASERGGIVNRISTW